MPHSLPPPARCASGQRRSRGRRRRSDRHRPRGDLALFSYPATPRLSSCWAHWLRSTWHSRMPELPIDEPIPKLQ